MDPEQQPEAHPPPQAHPPRPVVMDPLHITEFASERYFSKLNQKQEQKRKEQASSASESAHAATATATFSLLHSQSPFILPLRESKTLLAAEEPSLEPKQKKARFPFSRLRNSKSQVLPRTAAPTPTELLPVLADRTVKQKTPRSFDSLFLSLPTELQILIISPMPLHDILQMRLASRAWHATITAIESPIVRYHLKHHIPSYAKRLYPPDYANPSFHYLCGLWHRLNVAAKLSFYICEWVSKEIFLRNTEAQRQEFAPQRERMRRRLIPLLFTIFHFFETYRARHLQYIIDHDGKGLLRTPYTINPIEKEIMDMYDDRTLLQVHQVFPLVVASFCRRLRPPSYVGRVERSLRGYLKEKPADEVHVATLCIGGLRQVERFWEIRGYNSRRGAVDVWYNSVAKEITEPIASAASSTGITASTNASTNAKSRRNLMKLGRKKSSLAIRDDASVSTAGAKTSFDSATQAASARGSIDDIMMDRGSIIFHTSLAAGMPMGPMTQEQLRLLLPDLPVLQQLWLVTAEALILERKVVNRAADIRRNAQVMLDLIHEDGVEEEDQWWYGEAPHNSVRPPLDSIEEDVTEFNAI